MSDSRARAQSVFLNALEIASDRERSAYVDAECGLDEILRREVEELLGHAKRLGQFLEPNEAASPTINQPRTASTGDAIGPYKLLQKIGEGGMGVVYMAEQTEPVERRVALKIIKPGMDTRQVIARFEAERQALALMDHPNIARVLDAGTTDAGLPYFVMELVKGIPITQYCDEHRLSPRERLELVVPVCQAIQHAHQKGIIHRDIKPTNVLVAAYDGRPVPKVIDFGVAKAMGQKLTEHTLFTGFGGIVGTLEYMSPEQAEFNALDVDTRSDIYSLGVLIYELLTGTTPLPRERLKTAAITELLRVIREEEPPRPSTRLSESKDSLASISAQRKTEPAKLPRLVRGELDWIVMKAVEKDRSRRYETASALARDVECYLADDPVAACPPSLGYRLRKFVRRHKARAGILAASIVALLAFVGLGVALAYQARLQVANHNLEGEKRLLSIAKGELEQANNQLTGANQQLSQAQSGIEKANEELTGTNKQLTETNAKLDEAYDKLGRHAYADRLMLAQSEFDAGNGVIGQQLLEECEPQYRGWEWKHSHLKFHEHELAVFPAVGNSLAPNEATFTSDEERLAWSQGLWHDGDLSPDGQRQASTSKIHHIRLLNAHNGKCLAVLQGHTGDYAVRHVIFSPDGQLLASAGKDGTVRLWDAHVPMSDLYTGPIPEWMQGSVSQDPCVFRREFDGGSESATLLAASYYFRIVVFINDEQVADSAPSDESDDHWVAQCDIQRYLRQGKNTLTVQVFRESPWFTVHGETAFPAFIAVKAALTMNDGSARYVVSDKSWQQAKMVGGKKPEDGDWSPVGGGQTVDQWIDPGVFRPKIAPLATLQGHSQPVVRVAFSPDGQRLASASEDGTVRLWDVREAMPIAVLEGHAGTVDSVTFSPDGQRLASSGSDNTVRLWDALERKSLATLPGYNTAPIFSPDGRRLASNSQGMVRLWDSRDGKPLATLAGPNEGVGSTAFSPDGLRVATAEYDKTVRLWSARDGRLLSTLHGHTGGVDRVAFGPDGLRLASISRGANDNIVRLWDLSAGGAVAAMSAHTGPVSRIRFSPDGKLLASAGDDTTVRVWDALQGNLRTTLQGHAGAVVQLTFSPNGQRLASAGSDNTARLWDMSDGRLAATLEGHTGAVNDIAFSPNGRFLATGSQDKTLRLWDHDGKPLATIKQLFTLSPFSLRGHNAPVRSVAFSPNGAHLASGSDDSSIRLWDVELAAGPPAEWIWGGVAAAKDRYEFRTEFTGGSVSATLIAACDDSLQVFVNNVQVAENSNWQTPVKLEIQQHLHPEKNVLVVRAANDEGAAGLALKLVLRMADGTVRYVVTDKSWQAAKLTDDKHPPDQEWSDVTTLGPMGVEPWQDLFTPYAVGLATLIGGGTSHLTFTRGGQRLVSADWQVCLWDLRDVKNDASGSTVQYLATGVIGSPMLATFPGQAAGLHFALSRDERRLATGGADGTVRLWDLVNLPRPLGFVERDGDGTIHLQLDDAPPDATFFERNLPAPGSAGSATPLATMRGHAGAVYQVAFSPDGKLVASAGADGTVRLWDVREGKALAVLRGHTAAVNQVVFSPDGKSIASASADGTVRLWFSEDTSERRAYRRQLWREEQAEEAEAAAEWFAAAFHLGELLNQDRGNRSLEDRWEQAVAELARTDKALAEREAARVKRKLDAAPQSEEGNSERPD